MTRDEALRVLDEHLAQHPIMPEDAAQRAEWFVVLLQEAAAQGRRDALRVRVAVAKGSSLTYPERGEWKAQHAIQHPSGKVEFVPVKTRRFDSLGKEKP